MTLFRNSRDTHRAVNSVINRNSAPRTPGGVLTSSWSDDRGPVRVADVDFFVASVKALTAYTVTFNGEDNGYEFASALRKSEARLMRVSGTWLLFNASKELKALAPLGAVKPTFQRVNTLRVSAGIIL